MHGAALRRRESVHEMGSRATISSVVHGLRKARHDAVHKGTPRAHRGAGTTPLSTQIVPAHHA